MTLPTPILEALKEAGRVMLLGTVSWLLTDGILDMILTVIFGTRIDATTKAIIISALFTALRSADKWIHEAGKEVASKNMILGLTRF